MLIPVSVIDAWTRASRLRLSIEAGRGESLAFAGDAIGAGLDILLGLGRNGVAEIGTFGAFPMCSSGPGISATSGNEWNEDWEELGE